MVRPLLPTVTALSAHGLPHIRAPTSGRSGVSYVIPHHAAQLAQLAQLAQHRIATPPLTRLAAQTTSSTAVSSALRAPPHSFSAFPAPLLTRRPMSSASPSSPPAPPRKITFGPFDVSTQVFYETPLSFALVNLKPLLPGHVLVCPKKPHRRLTDLDAAELVDLFAAVQVVQRMLAALYFADKESTGDQHDGAEQELLRKGSFNIAVQDGPEAGQTVPHVHVHVIPRIRGTTAKDSATEGDALYEQLADEPGNVGGAQWDAAPDTERQDGGGSRPQPGGRFPRIEDSSRVARTMAAMEAEAAEFRQALASLGIGNGEPRHKE